MKAGFEEEIICLRASREFFDGATVNLGGGMPALCAMMMPEDRTVLLMYENGVLGFGAPIAADEIETLADPDFVGPSGQFLRVAPGMAVFDFDRAFDMIRGGHIDISVLGAYEVSEKGDLANWFSNARPVPSVGGAMDLAANCPRVIVTMTHRTRSGKPKIVKETTLPITGRRCVNLIVTDLAVIDVTPAGLVLKEIAPGWTPEEVQALTEPKLIVADDLKDFQL